MKYIGKYCAMSVMLVLALGNQLTFAKSIKELEKQTYEINKYGALDLSGNRISSLEGLSELKIQLPEIPLKYIGQPMHIHFNKIKLNNNQISDLGDAFTGQHQFLYLQHLDLSNNKLKILNRGSFGNLQILLSLNLAKNPISTIERGAFSGLSKIREVIFSRLERDEIEKYARQISEDTGKKEYTIQESKDQSIVAFKK